MKMTHHDKHHSHQKTRLSYSELRGIGLVIIGIVALFYYYSWWFQAERLGSPWLVLSFIAALFYSGSQLLGSWLVYLGTHRQAHQLAARPQTELTVDVFVTACGEDIEMIQQALTAAHQMRGHHRTWLLDDSNNPQLNLLAKALGVEYLARPIRADAKAGNINAALKRTSGDIIVLFDIDHTPAPNFLEQTLYHFTNPAVGFVQVMPSFSNHRQGWVAQAASETSFDFYNPTSIGMDGMGGVTKMGTNSLIRRKALESIGGYQPGLAEDLATSITLHAAGWESHYVAEPLAPGLVPPDLVAWFTQQFKWARGVFEVLLTTMPRLWSRLTWGQRLSYSVRTTKYLIGPFIFIHLASLIGGLLSGQEQVLKSLTEYYLCLAPLMLMDMIIRHLALRKWHHPSLITTSLWRAVILVYATWPIYTLAWLMAILRLPLAFRPTPKNNTNGINPLWLLPQLISVILLEIGLFISLNIMGQNPRYFLLLGAVICFIIPQIGLVRPLLRSIFRFGKRQLTRPGIALPGSLTRENSSHNSR